MTTKKTAELDKKFEGWLSQKWQEGGDWHYEEDFRDDIEFFIREEAPDATEDEISEISKVYFDENYECRVERGSRYAEEDDE